MSVLYLYRCPVHGEVEIRKPMALSSRLEFCEACGDEPTPEGWDPWDLAAPMQRVYTPPVTDCASFGRNSFTTRTLPIHRTPQDELQEERINSYQKKYGTHRRFGAGQTTGS